MNAPQTFPSVFAPLTKHIDRLRLEVLTEPTAWIIQDNKFIKFNSPHPRRRIEQCEHWLSQQQNIGCLSYVATIRTALSIEGHTIIQLYNGAQFSHTVFQPHTPSRIESWWIEPWQLDHLLR